jgi:hypothetical protein
MVQKGNGFEILLFLWSGISHHIKNPHFGGDWWEGKKDRKEKRSCRRSHRAMVFSGESLMESPPSPCRMGTDNPWQIKEKRP